MGRWDHRVGSWVYKLEVKGTILVYMETPSGLGSVFGCFP